MKQRVVVGNSTKRSGNNSQKDVSTHNRMETGGQKGSKEERKEGREEEGDE